MMEPFTALPNIYVDEYLSELSGAETKVLIVILRKTVGWQKESDEISLSQIEKITGLARHSVIAGLRGLMKRGLVVQTKPAEGNKPASYKCVMPPVASAKGATSDELKGGDKCTDCTTRSAEFAPIASATTALDDNEQCNHCTTVSAESAPQVVQFLHPQNKEKEKKEREGARSSRALSHSRESSNGKTSDYLDHALDRLDGRDPAERTIRAWSLPPHLEAQCLAFARVFEVAPTRGDKKRWAKAAETLHELRCDEARLKAARDEARKAGLICTWPGAIVNLSAIRSVQNEYELVYDEERGGYVRKPKRN